MHTLKPYGIIFLLSLFLELSLFNYKYYLTSGNEEYMPEYETGSGLFPMGNGRYLVMEEGELTITLPGIDREIDTLRLDIGYSTQKEVPEKSPERERAIVRGYEDKKLYVDIEAQDEANELGFSLGRRDIVHEVQQTTYMRVHLSGKSEWVKYTLSARAGEFITLYAVTVNPGIPFYFSLARVLSLGVLLSFLWLLRPKSCIYRYLCRESMVQEVLIWCCILTEIVLFSRLALLNPYYMYPRWSHHNQYYSLAEAFHEGQLYLKEEPPEFLQEMENPYDTDLRSFLASEAGESARWDHAYYNGRYYVYFGVVPELLFYYPYYELAGSVDEEGEFKGGILSHVTIIFLCAAVEVIAVYLLLWEVIRLWYSKIPFVLYLIMSAAFSMGCGVLTILLKADFYSVPILCGLSFSLLGLWFWLSAKRGREESIKEGDGKGECAGLSAWRLCAGSLCMALVAGCRPQMLIMSFLAVVLFWEDVRERRLLIGKNIRSAVNTVCFVLPYLAVAAGLMWYNYARFGSLFDFGANYNLTTNDMTARGFQLGRIGLGLFTCLFQPVNLEGVFPFIIRNNFATTYLGRTIHETTYGGVFAANLILLPLLFLPWLRRCYKEPICRRLTLFSFVFAVAVLVADTQMAGILPRYYSDYTWMLYLALCPLMFSLYEYCTTCGEKLPMHLYRLFLAAASLQGILFHFLRIYAGSSNSLVIGNPVKFYQMAHLIAFWR